MSEKSIENSAQVHVELLEQLRLTGEALRVLSHEVLEAARHAKEAYERHAHWLLELDKRQQELIAHDDSDSSGGRSDI
jgi:hypothetical protein